MIVYEAERKLGLAELVQANKSVASCQPLIPVNQKDFDIYRTEAKIDLSLPEGADSFDLYPTHTIMVSVGSNENDDDFLAEEIWNAKASPVNKPFNFEHQPSKVIGHIVASRVVDESLNLISDSTTFEELPNKFHILASSVIYKHLSSKEPGLEEAIAQLITEIEDGKWYVSMETLFSNFDYGLISEKDGVKSVVARDQNSAWLTKHLKCYGGKGYYEDYRLVRVLRNLTFSGKGLVKEPANPGSVFVFYETSDLQTSTASLVKPNNKVQESKMSENTVSLADYQASQARINELTKRLDDMQENAVKDKYAQYEKSVAEKQGFIDNLKVEIENLKTAKAEVEKELETSKASYGELNKKFEDSQNELKNIQAEAKKTERVSTLVSVGVDKAEAEKVVDKFVNADDEMFSEVVASKKELVEAKKMKEDPKKDSKKKEEKDKAMAGKEETEDEGDADAAQASLENAEPEKNDPSLATASLNKDSEELMSTLASFLGQQLNNSNEEGE